MAISNLASVQPAILSQQFDGSQHVRRHRSGEPSQGSSSSATSPSSGTPASTAISTISASLYALPGDSANRPTTNIVV